MAAQATAVTDDAAPYEAIVRLAERELELAGEGRYEEIAQLGRERAQLLAALPAAPPSIAREALCSNGTEAQSSSPVSTRSGVSAT